MMGRGLVYTANFGNYDTPKPVRHKEGGVDYIAFTDHELRFRESGWDTKEMDGHQRLLHSPRFFAREAKVLVPLRNRDDYDWWLWVDGTMQIVGPVREFCEKALAKHDFAAWRHFFWDCSHTEIERCRALKKDHPKNLEKAAALLKKAKFPRHYGQLASGILLRKNTDLVKKHAEAWWRDMEATTMRDQVTFMLNLWRLGAQIQWLPKTIDQTPWVKFHRGHARPPRGR